ncbi:MAG: MazG nucleotide pyrophosphohydrolase domain-containing protein [Candidatus Gracilibacteria bacterium]|nr:MazG nucleotide pyrophosphohydrolase domain-containing protein [Candidatus Gracilibacteria bacterium]
MHHTLTKLIDLADDWITQYEEDAKSKSPKYADFYKGWETYFNGVIAELQEVKDEVKPDNRVYLEDELGDVIWTYLCLLKIFEKKGYIKDLKKVFERSYKKLSERISARREDQEYTYSTWQNVKKKQKKELLDEHNSIYGNDI